MLKKVLEKVKGLHINAMQIVIFVLSFFMALSVWFIQNLSRKYSKDITVQILVVSNMDGYKQKSEAPVTIYANVSSSGFNLARDYLFSRKVKEVYIAGEYIEKAEKGSVASSSDVFFISAEGLQNYYKNIFGENFKVEKFHFSRLKLTFQKEDSKKVPIHLDSQIKLKSQYKIVGKIKLKPDSLTIYGNPEDLKNINELSTNLLRKTNVDASLYGQIGLEKIRKIRFSSDKIAYNIEVKRYISIEKKDIEVFVENLPKDKKVLLLPKTVNLRYDCLFPFVSEPKEEIKVAINYEDFEKSISGHCIAYIVNPSSDILSYEITPQVIECVAY